MSEPRQPHEWEVRTPLRYGSKSRSFHDTEALARAEAERLKWAAMTDEMDTTARRLLSDMADYVKEQA